MYSREIDEKILTLGASGWLYNDTFVLLDYETESLWYHIEGDNSLTCISGFYADHKLAEYLSWRTRWNNWLRYNPDSKYLKYP